ncbi:cytochrome b [Serratia quinivorans]|uniref:cytochrome b n=1 Tax=Serratia quinivorans TaxID=137545 RepID=UPI002178F0FF|nr:cytochrome b [Serratia quinivorans]CAI0699276.1 Cytochrome b561 homolog 1 [Serratia quinivorans]CAI0699950.1 Cytochrome b561 homolog 1 [Serratia quinivorans]CAI0727200.1 Cytochrome b561 homolog 1 [Serratia quinivorans]CAI1635819.1 Cytochrome b561 homolog 1 [Serratia quinivorans]CAI2042497.1 Cytochrome b561 homolog 1 [Serratia quinivorans]
MGNRYAKSQIVLHWLTLLMVILTYAAMLLKDSVPDDITPLIKNLHFNFGLAVFLLMLIRLGLRRRHGTPATTPPLEEWQDVGAKVFHWLLYVIFLTLPVLGMLTLAYGGKTWVLLGWQVPQWITPDPVMRRLIKTTHETLANVGYFIIGAHTLAALYHHYLRKDDTLRRMMPGK